MKTEIIKAASRMLFKTGLKIKKYSPEMLVGAGVVGIVASTVMACKATTKVEDVLADSKEKLEKIHEAQERMANGEELVCKNGSTYTEKDMKNDLTITYTKAALECVKLYGPAVALGAVSIGCIIWSHCILSKRNVALAAAYATVDKGFKEYRGRVVERFGKELDRELRYNIKAREVEEIVVDENGEEKVVTSTVEIPELNGMSSYSVCFDETCAGWTRDAEYNKTFLLSQQNFANKKLQEQGFLFLNDVYEMLGFQKTKAGQVVGWIYDEDNTVGDNYIDFGIFNISSEPNRRFVNGYEKSIWLDFNVDGNILENF